MTANQSPPARPDGDARSAIFNILNEEITQPRPEYLPAHFNNAVTRLTALFAERATSPARDAAEEAGTPCSVQGCGEVVGDTKDPRWDQGQCPQCGKWFWKSAPPKPAPDAVREARLVIEAARNEIVLTIAYLGRDGGTERAPATIKALIDRLAKTDAKLRTYLAAFAWVVLSDVTGNTRMWTRNGDVAKAFAAKHLLECVELYRSPSATEPPERELHGSSMPPDRGAAVPVCCKGLAPKHLCRCDQEGHAITPPVRGDREATPSSDGAGEKMSFDELTHISERMDYIEAHADEGGTGSPANLQEMVGYIRRLVSFADRVLQGFGDVTPLGGQEAIADIADELESLAGDVHENSATTDASTKGDGRLPQANAGAAS